MVLCLLVSIRFQVLFHSPPGVLFTFPSRYYSLSVTWSYLALWDGPHSFRQNFSCFDVLRILLSLSSMSITGLSPSMDQLSNYIHLLNWVLYRSPYPKGITTFGLGSSDFARHYFRNRVYFLFLRVLRCFSSPGSPHYTMNSCNDNTLLTYWVPSFGNLRIIRYLLLPAAYRSLSRPSSAPCTKASSVCSL